MPSENVAMLICAWRAEARAIRFVWSYPVGELHTVPARGSVVVDLEGESMALNLAHGASYPTSFGAFYSL